MSWNTMKALTLTSACTPTARTLLYLGVETTFSSSHSRHDFHAN